MEIILKSKYNENDNVFINTPYGWGRGIIKKIKWQYDCFMYLVEFELGKYWLRENELFPKGD